MRNYGRYPEDVRNKSEEMMKECGYGAMRGFECSRKTPIVLAAIKPSISKTLVKYSIA